MRDPLGKRALFETPVVAAPDQIAPGPARDGRTALFSTTPRRIGTVLVECSACAGRSRISVADMGVRMSQLGLFMPTRRHHQYLLRCPSCDERRWCSVAWRS
jgi:hypothetical protein